MKEYEISPQTGKCSVTQRRLEEGEAFYAVLFETTEGFERKDYSLQAWEEPPEGFFCYWKSRVPQKQEKKRRFVDAEVIMNLFLRLEDSQEEVKLHFRFVLALILMRKRLLKYQQTLHEDGAEYWEMRVTGEEILYRVLNPKLNDEQIETVSKELGAILHGDTGTFDELATSPVEADTRES